MAKTTHGGEMRTIFEILKDGAWHSTRDLYDRVKPGGFNWACRSRISDLRAGKLDGKLYQIEIRPVEHTAGKLWEYRFVREVAADQRELGLVFTDRS